MSKKRVYSGIRATGRLHLGNYLGAVKGMLALQDDYDCVFSVVDLHAMTTPYDPKMLKDSVRNVLLDFLGAGLDPKNSQIEDPHLEVAREIARKFNGVYGETFPEPKRFATAGEYVPSLAGKGKMSKTVE